MSGVIEPVLESYYANNLGKIMLVDGAGSVASFSLSVKLRKTISRAISR